SLPGGRVPGPDRTGVPRVRPLTSLATAMAKGFFRDKMALFFSILFPLMFLVLFGGLFANQGASKTEVIQVGEVALMDQAPPTATASLKIKHSNNLSSAMSELRKGDVDAVLTQQGDELKLHYSRTDQITAATVRGTVQAIVQSANVARS